MSCIKLLNNHGGVTLEILTFDPNIDIPYRGFHCCIVVHINVIQQLNLFFNWMNRPSDDSPRRIIPVQFWELLHTWKHFFVVVIFIYFFELKKKKCYQIWPWKRDQLNQLKGCIGKSTSGKKYQVEYGTFSLGKSTILVVFPIGTFSINNRKKYHIVFHVTFIVCIFLIPKYMFRKVSQKTVWDAILYLIN